MIRLTRTSSNPPAASRLDGSAVFLRPPQTDEWSAWAELRADSRYFLTPWEPTWPPDALNESAYLRRVRRLATEWKTDEGYSFHVFQKERNCLVGGIGLTQVKRGVAQIGTLGYWVGEPFQGRGYITEAVKLISRFAFTQLNLHRVEAACLPENIASRRVLEKAGFVREGYARLYLKIAGDWRDHLTFALLQEDFEAGK
jgi:[ribosomal protein S5]-alanine N-acetyltransferase